MRRAVLSFCIACVVASVGAFAQQEEPPQTSTLPGAGAKAFAAKPKLPVPPKNAAPTPLNPHDRALQMLDRFTFGAKPGQLDQVIAQGTDKWFEQQLNPDAIPDGAKDRRMGDFPTLGMSAEQALLLFPDRNAIGMVTDGKAPYPTDPLLGA